MDFKYDNDEIDCEFNSISFEEVKQKGEIISRKFLAFIICVLTGLVAFLLVLFKFNNVDSLHRYLDFVLWVFVAYIGGSSAENLTHKIFSKTEK